WWEESEVGVTPKVAPSLQERCEEELSALGAEMVWPPTFESAHDRATTRAVARTLNAHARCFEGNPSWSRRQAWFHHRAAEAVTQHKSRRTLAFVGAQHRPELEFYLGSLGLAVRSPLTLEHSALDARRATAVPASVLDAWK